MNQLQEVELDLLKVVDRICNDLGVRYYLVCGSALGAVKYNGFIPWDDDVDVAMYRGDYETFIRQAPQMLPRELFLQNYHTDPRFPQIFSKLRNSETTYIETATAKLPIHHGVFIDIFPLDGYPSGRIRQAVLEVKKKIYKSVMYSSCDVARSPKGEFVAAVCRMMGLASRTNRVAYLYDRMVSKYDPLKSKVICNHGNWQGKWDYSPVEHYGNGCEVEFEGIKAYIPEDYHAYLTRKYGNYIQDIPEDEKAGHHYCEICDCSKSYRHYVS